MASYASQPDIARPHFHMDAFQNKAKSEQEGRPIFDEKEMVRIVLPGDKHLTWVGEVTDEHRQRWPEQYAAFKRGEERAASGTPLEQWTSPNMTRSRVAELKALNILAVEELASVPDSALTKIGMGARELREEARAYIDSAKDNSANAAMAARIAQLEEMVMRLSGTTQAAPEPPKQEKTLEDCTDAELKEYIRRVTGEPVLGNPKRETLLMRAAEAATKDAEAA